MRLLSEKYLEAAATDPIFCRQSPGQSSGDGLVEGTEHLHVICSLKRRWLIHPRSCAIEPYSCSIIHSRSSVRRPVARSAPLASNSEAVIATFAPAIIALTTSCPVCTPPVSAKSAWLRL